MAAIEQILKDFTEFEIPLDMDKELKTFMKMVGERTYDYFREAEGMSADSVTLPDGIEIREDK